MSQKLSKIPQLLLSELSDREQMLWQLLREREDFIVQLKDEIARLKGEKAKPKIKPSRLEPSAKSQLEAEGESDGSTDEEKEKKKRAGSAKRINQIIVERKEKYHWEKQEILRVGLLGSSYINTDDTSARHQGKNSYGTHIGNEWFAWFETTPKKNRINFLELLRGEKRE